MHSTCAGVGAEELVAEELAAAGDVELLHGADATMGEVREPRGKNIGTRKVGLFLHVQRGKYQGPCDEVTP